MKLLLSLLLVGEAIGFTTTKLPTPTSHVTSRKKSTSAICMADPLDDFLSKIKVPNFPSLGGGGNDSSVTPTPPTALPPIEFKPTPEALFSRARAVLASDMAAKEESLLDDEFRWIGPNVAATGALNKEEYLAAARFFDLRSAFPDLEFRAHDFRIDDEDPLTVRFTARTVGTMRGELRLRTETLPPNGKRMRCPPEAISMTFDETTGKVTKMCSGFTMDRLVGNTAGLCGVMAAATVAGAPPSEWEIYPPTAVVSRFFGRTVKQLEEPSSFLAPFPESVMIQLAKGVIASELGTSDPDLLAPSFTFCGPIVGPIGKDDFLTAFGGFDLKTAFPDLDPQYYNFRVDPYDPYRVWVDTKRSGTWTGPLNGKEPNGAKYEGPLEAASFTFDDDGFCTRLTAGAVIDPTIGNTGGLGGVYGIFYAVGAPLPAAATRALPQILTRLQKAALKPITKTDIDDYKLEGKAASSSDEKASTDKAPDATQSPPPVPPKPAAALSIPKIELPKPVAPPAEPPSVPKATTPKAPKIKVSIPKPKPPAPVKKPVKPKTPTAPKKSTKPINISADPADPVSDTFALFFGTKTDGKSKSNVKVTKPQKSESTKTKALNKQKEKADVLKSKADARRKEVEERKVAAAAEAEAKKKAAAQAAADAKRKEAEQKKAAQQAMQVSAKRKEAEERKAAAEAAAETKRKVAEERKAAAEAAAEAQKKAAEERKAAAEAKRKEAEQKKAQEANAKQAVQAMQKAKPGQTKSLFGFGAPKAKADEPSSETASKPARPPAAPKGVPTITKWKQNRDGSISGFITGSPSFKDGEAITTSSITGEGVGGAVVQTSSGSRYYLEKQTREQATSAAGFFGLFGGGSGSSAETKSKEQLTPAQAAAEKRKEEAAAAAEAKKKAMDAKRKEAEEKKASSVAAAEAKRKEAEEIKEKAAKMRKAEQAMKKAKPGATIPISALGFGKPQPKVEGKAQAPARPTTVKAKSPKGVPTIKKWRQNKDGSIVGSITGSPNFKEGEVVTTSPITGEAIGGTVVQTSSRSRYFLEEQTKEQANIFQDFFGLFGGGPAAK